MKPYTLEWWMDNLFRAKERSEWAVHQYKWNRKEGNIGISDEWHNESVRYDVLFKYIYNQIIKKYGD